MFTFLSILCFKLLICIFCFIAFAFMLCIYTVMYGSVKPYWHPLKIKNKVLHCISISRSPEMRTNMSNTRKAIFIALSTG